MAFEKCDKLLNVPIFDWIGEVGVNEVSASQKAILWLELDHDAFDEPWNETCQRHPAKSDFLQEIKDIKESHSWPNLIKILVLHAFCRLKLL